MSMIENEAILEQYYEQFIDQGHTQEDAERLANKMMENRGDNGYEDYIEEED